MPTKERRAREAHRFAEDRHLADIRDRWHAAQSDPTVDTAGKRLARQAGVPTVQCSCGTPHSSAVRRP